MRAYSAYSVKPGDEKAKHELEYAQVGRYGDELGGLLSTRTWSAAERSAPIVDHLGERLGAEHALAPALEIGDVSGLDAGDGSLW